MLPPRGARLLSDLGAAEIGAYQRDRLAAGAAPKTINLEIGTLRAILLRHRIWQFVKQDVRILPVAESVGRALSAAEEAALLEACAASSSLALYPAVVLALHTGTRSIELRFLRWAQVDLVAQLVRMERSKTDAGTGRMIPLNSRAALTLLTWAANFPCHVVSRVLGGVSRAAGYDRWTAGANGADDAHSCCGQTLGARDGLCSAPDSSGSDPATGAGWNDSSTCFLAVAVSGQCAGMPGRNCLGGVVPAG